MCSVSMPMSVPLNVDPESPSDMVAGRPRDLSRDSEVCAEPSEVRRGPVGVTMLQ